MSREDNETNHLLVTRLRRGEAEALRSIHRSPAPGKADAADRLGCTTTWIAETTREGELPESCIVPGTGNGKPWKFYRRLIDEWIESR
jgi:hypothetical protein